MTDRNNAEQMILDRRANLADFGTASAAFLPPGGQGMEFVFTRSAVLAIAAALRATGNPATEKRKAFTSVGVDIARGEVVRIFATDDYRAFHATKTRHLGTCDADGRWLLPPKPLKAWVRSADRIEQTESLLIRTDGEGCIRLITAIRVGQQHGRRLGDWTLEFEQAEDAQLIDGTYPCLDLVFPKEAQAIVEVDAAHLLFFAKQIVSAQALAGNDKARMEVRFGPDSAEIAVSDLLIHRLTWEAELPYEVIAGDVGDLLAAYNAAYFVDFLEAVRTARGDAVYFTVPREPLASVLFWCDFNKTVEGGWDYFLTPMQLL